MKFFIHKIFRIRSYPIHPSAQFITPYTEAATDFSETRNLSLAFANGGALSLTPGLPEFLSHVYSAPRRVLVRKIPVRVLIYRAASWKLPQWFSISFALVLFALGVVCFGLLREVEIQTAKKEIVMSHQQLTLQQVWNHEKKVAAIEANASMGRMLEALAASESGKFEKLLFTLQTNGNASEKGVLPQSYEDSGRVLGSQITAHGSKAFDYRPSQIVVEEETFSAASFSPKAQGAPVLFSSVPEESTGTVQTIHQDSGRVIIVRLMDGYSTSTRVLEIITSQGSGDQTLGFVCTVKSP